MPWDWTTYAQWPTFSVLVGVPAGLASAIAYSRINPVRLSPWTWLLSVCQFPTVLAVWIWLDGPESGWLLFAALTLPGWMMYRSSRRDVRRTQERRDRRAREIAAAVIAARPPRFALYLRAFGTTRRLISQPTGGGVGSGDSFPVHLDLETVVHSALWREMPLIAAGRPGDIGSGAGRVVLTDDGWQSGVAALAHAAELVVIIPSANPGTLWEMNWLREHGKLDQTIFVMPEFPKDPQMRYSVNPFLGSGFVRRYDSAEHYLDHARDWDAAVEAAATIGLALPPYRYEGALFRLDRSGHVRVVRPLSLISIGRRVRRVRQLLNELRDPPAVPPPVRSVFTAPRFDATALAGLTATMVVTTAFAFAVLQWLPRWLQIAAWSVLGVITVIWLLRTLLRPSGTPILTVDETGLSLRSSKHDGWRWPWTEIVATEIVSAPGDQCLAVFPVAPSSDSRTRFWQEDRYVVAGLRFMGIDERDLVTALTHFSGGRHRESPGRWVSQHDRATPPEPRDHRMADDLAPLSGSWLPDQTWLGQSLGSRLGFACAWLLVGGLSLWGWYGWTGFASGFWAVLALPLWIFGLYAVLNRLPTALGGKRLLLSSSGMTFFPPGSVRPPVYLPWEELRSVTVPADWPPEIVAEPVGPPIEDSPAHGLWSAERGRYAIGIAGIPLSSVRVALSWFREVPTDAG